MASGSSMRCLREFDTYGTLLTVITGILEMAFEYVRLVLLGTIESVWKPFSSCEKMEIVQSHISSLRVFLLETL
jgi:hypothetical protein